MTYGLSTRAVGTPAGTAGQFAPAKQPMQIVPLSLFFLDKEREQASAEQGEQQLFGFRRGKAPVGSKGKGKGKKKRKGKQPSKRAGAGDDNGEVAGGGTKAVDAATANGDGQSTASQTPQESVTMATGTPLISPSGTSTWNVDTVAVPIGGDPLRRKAPVGKKKRRKKKQESRDRWIGRLGKLMQS